MTHQLEIIIPTLGRLHQQKTLLALPAPWRARTTLVVQEHEFSEASALAVGHGARAWCLPPGTKGIAWTRKHIAEHWRGKRVFVMDDDLKFVQITRGDGGKLVGRAPVERDFTRAFAEVERFMDMGIMHGGFSTHTTPPVDAPHTFNTRIWTNVFYSERFPVDTIDFGTDYELMPEDFYVTLQLLTRGFQNVVFNHFRVAPAATNAKGGCETYRTIENHNRGQEILAEKFPRFVKVTTKVQQSGPWAGLEKKALTIQWKRAYEYGARRQS